MTTARRPMNVSACRRAYERLDSARAGPVSRTSGTVLLRERPGPVGAGRLRAASGGRSLAAEYTSWKRATLAHRRRHRRRRCGRRRAPHSLRPLAPPRRQCTQPQAASRPCAPTIDRRASPGRGRPSLRTHRGVRVGESERDPRRQGRRSDRAQRSRTGCASRERIDWAYARGRPTRRGLRRLRGRRRAGGSGRTVATERCGERGLQSERKPARQRTICGADRRSIHH
jgi:hypothetical protein